MSLASLFAIDLVAIAVLVFGLSLPRHHRRDLAVALLGINVGVLAVTQALSSAEVGVGVGLGLFGILSIIRLRSTEMDSSEVAYYFSALTLGILGGFPLDPAWLSPALMGAVLVAMAVGDHPRLGRRLRQQRITLDRAYLDEDDLRARLGELLPGRIHRVTVRETNLVTDITIVEVRYEHDDTVGAADRAGACSPYRRRTVDA
ncbi:MAG: DUF4956 domain-containing protein [Desertimonas sp.]